MQKDRGAEGGQGNRHKKDLRPQWQQNKNNLEEQATRGQWLLCRVGFSAHVLHMSSLRKTLPENAHEMRACSTHASPISHVRC